MLVDVYVVAAWTDMVEIIQTIIIHRLIIEKVIANIHVEIVISTHRLVQNLVWFESFIISSNPALNAFFFRRPKSASIEIEPTALMVPDLIYNVHSTVRPISFATILVANNVRAIRDFGTLGFRTLSVPLSLTAIKNLVNLAIFNKPHKRFLYFGSPCFDGDIYAFEEYILFSLGRAICFRGNPSKSVITT